MALACLLALALAAVPTSPPDEQRRLWRDTVGFTEAQIAAAESGQVVTRAVPTREDNNVVIAGATRISVSKETLVASIRELRVLGGSRVVGFGRFRDPARLEDLAGLALDRQDLIDLRKCRPGDCELKLGEAGMEIARRVDWKAGGASAEAERLLKQALVDAIGAYRARGTMAVYLDNDPPENVAEELAKVLEDSPRSAPAQALLHYTLDFPRASLEGSEDIFYWSQTKLQKMVTSLHHLVIQKDGEGPATRYHVADKHLLDSHYFLGYLDVLTITDAGPSAGSCYVTALNRTRIDPPSRFRATLLRRIKSRMKELMEEDLVLLRSRVEANPKREPAPQPAPPR